MQHYYRAVCLLSWLLLGLNYSTWANDKSTALDTDGDGIVNACDADSDNDGIPDIWEDPNQNNTFSDDDLEGSLLTGTQLGDGTPDYLDLDSDNDGVLDLFESGVSLSLINLYDADHNGILSGPVGTNGFLDALETFPDSGIPIYRLRDSDGDGIPNFNDLTSDGNNFDLYNINPNLDVFGLGYITAINDPDKDGIQAVIDSDPAGRGAPNSPLSPFTVNYTMVASTASLNTPCALPVRIVRFSAVENEQAILLQWEIADASNFSHFEVERSADLARFESIGRIAFAEGQRFYQLRDKRPQPGVMYYRLKLIDLDATFNYSKTLSIRLSEAITNWQVGPNPSTGVLKLNGLEVGSRVELMDMQGRGAVLLGIASESTAQFDVGTRPADLYLLKVSSPAGQIDSKRILLQK
jgi:hypothetical protein